MRAEDAFVQNGSYRHVVEAVVEHLPHVYRQTMIAFVEEGEIFLNVSNFVISSHQVKVVRSQYFETEQKNAHLDAPITSIHIVTKEKIFARIEEWGIGP